MFDTHTQKTLDRIALVVCPMCGKHFLKRGVPGTTVPTLMKHLATHGKQDA